MTANTHINLWMASDATERDGLGSDDGVAVGDFCLVSDDNLYIAQSVSASSSTWRPMAGLPTTGWYAMGAKNTADSANRALYIMNAQTFRAVLEGSPSSVSLSTVSSFNWPNTPSIHTLDQFGFTFSGSSSSVTANTNAWRRGRYTVSY